MQLISYPSDPCIVAGNHRPGHHEERVTPHPVPNDRRVTVYDIAKRLNMSASTVSRVLNNSTLVGPETRERILQAADEMGYLRRRIRRHGGRTILNVALFLPYGGNNYLHLFYDAAEFIHALGEGFADVRANIVAVVNGPDVQIFDQKKLGDIDACVFGFTSPRPETLAVIDERAIPVVLINRTDPNHNYVVSDHAGGMALLVDELVAGDPQVRPFYLGFPVIPQVSELRLDGLVAACEKRGVPFRRTDAVDIGQISEITPTLIERLLGAGYTALVCFNDVLAVYTYQCALGMGLRIPQDFSLTGFDNSPVRSLVSEPIVSVDLGVPQMGYHAGRWLRDAIIEKTLTSLHLHLPGNLVPGATVRGRQLTTETKES